MVNKDKTKEEIKLGAHIYVICDTCSKTEGEIRRIRIQSKIVDGDYRWQCVKCRNNNSEYREELKKRWTPEFRKTASENGRKQWTPEYRQIMSENGKKQWTPEYRKMMYDKYYSDPKYLSRMSKIQEQFRDVKSRLAKIQWNDPVSRAKLIAAISSNTKKLWKNESYRRLIAQRITEYYIQCPEARIKQQNEMTEKWQNIEFYDKMMAIIRSEENRNRLSKLWDEGHYNRWINSPEFRKIIHNRWNDPNLRERMKVKFTPELKEKLSAHSKERMSDPALRQKLSEYMKRKWQNTEYKLKMLLSSKPVSSLQDILYSILDDLGVKYYREYNDKPSDTECFIGPYSFDCVIPRDNQKTLLIECQGEYWHGRDNAITRDLAKATYIANNLSDKYELKCLWEHEFFNRNKIIETLKIWLGLENLPQIDFDFNSVILKECPATDYRLLLSKYHYLPNAGRGGFAVGAYLNNVLIGICVFSPLIRQNIAITGSNKPKELSRFCIHPSYQKENFGSWFISRAVKMLPDDVDAIVAYSDTTFNHLGTIYKACNFILDGKVDPDYWYVSNDGWVMHKKTLYNHAIKFNMKEAEYASTNGYSKVYGKEKLRYIFRR